MPPIEDVVARAAEQHVAAEHADQDVVAAPADQRVGVVEALVGGDARGLDLGVVRLSSSLPIRTSERPVPCTTAAWSGAVMVAATSAAVRTISNA